MISGHLTGNSVVLWPLQMESLAALALACNVLQLVGEGISITKEFKRLYRRGSLEENDKIKACSEQITTVSKTLAGELQTLGSSSSALSAIRRSCDKVLETANELRSILDNLELCKQKSKTKFGAVLKATWKQEIRKGQIESLQKDFERQQDVLRLHLQTDLW